MTWEFGPMRALRSSLQRTAGAALFAAAACFALAPSAAHAQHNGWHGGGGGWHGGGGGWHGGGGWGGGWHGGWHGGGSWGWHNGVWACCFTGGVFIGLPPVYVPPPVYYPPPGYYPPPPVYYPPPAYGY
jgi:hypothetical protein